MKSVWKWLLVGGGAFVLVFVLALPFLGGWGWGGCSGAARGGFGPGMMGYGGFGPTMMGGGYNMMGLGFLGMFGMVLVPLAVLALGVVGIVALLRSSQVTPPSVAPAAPTCANCGQPVQTGWVACPHCGQKL